MDSVVLTVINRREIKPDDFQSGDHGLRLTRPALKRFLTRYDARVNGYAPFDFASLALRYAQGEREMFLRP